MPQQNKRPGGGEVQTETGEQLKGPKPLNLSKERGLSKGDDKKRAEQSAKEGPAAYAPHNETENAGKDPTKKKTGEF